MVKQRLRIHHPSGGKNVEEDPNEKNHFIDPHNHHPHNNNDYVPDELGSTFPSPSLFDVESPPILDSIANKNKKQKMREKIIFRSIQPSDRQMIQRLHEEWFPVRYQSEFYDDLVHGKMYPTGDPLFTKVAVVVVGDDGHDGDNDLQDVEPVALSGSSQTQPNYPHNTNGDDNSNNDHHYKDQTNHQNNERIVACIVATIVPAHRLNRSSRELLLPDSFQGGRRMSTISSAQSSSSTSSTPSACYIMTLGTVLEYRQYGLATTLVEQCIQEMVLPLPACGALYLHVLTTNLAAIRFYEQDRLKFHRVTELFNYYVIDQQHYNCYLYAKYFHGNRGHLDIFQILAWWVLILWSKIKEPLLFFWLKQRQHQQQYMKRIGHGGRRDEQDSQMDRHANSYRHHGHDDDDSVSLE